MNGETQLEGKNGSFLWFFVINLQSGFFSLNILIFIYIKNVSFKLLAWVKFISNHLVSCLLVYSFEVFISNFKFHNII